MDLARRKFIQGALSASGSVALAGHPFLLFAASAATPGAEQASSAAAKLNRIPDTCYELQGVMEEYITAVTEHWLLTMSERNPAILQMFADRNKQPRRALLEWSGEFAGTYLAGATLVFRLTHDPRLKDCLSKFVANLAQVQADDGYLGTNSQGERWNWGWDVWNHYYTMLGLLLWHEETGDPKALQGAVKIGDLLCRTFLHSGRRIVDIGHDVDFNHVVNHSLCLLYKVTKTPAYLELARQITDEEFQDKRAGDYVREALAGKEYYQGPKPRFEALHSIQGLAELYWITGSEDYRKAVEQIWWSIAKLERHNFGSASSYEEAKGNPYLEWTDTCDTIWWMALSVDMLRLTGNSIVADELELSTYNAVLGYQHRSGKWVVGEVRSDGVRPTGIAHPFQIRPGSEELNCCSAEAPRGFGLISDWALMTDGRGLVLNWYGPSTMTAQLKTTTVTIKQQTDYPRQGQILLNVSPERVLRFPLKLRIPSWSANSSVQVNGHAVFDVKPGSYLVLDREWKPGDTVQVDLDMSLHYWVGERECAGKTSIYHGPLLLVYELQHQDPDRIFSDGWKDVPSKDSGALVETTVEDTAAAWKGSKSDDADRTSLTIDEKDVAAVDQFFSDGWKDMATKDPGAFVETTFEGTAVTWKGSKSDDAGQARVTIDGKDVAVVDQYGPKRGEPVTWEFRHLRPGEHTLKLTVLDQKNPNSKDYWIKLGAIVPSGYAGPELDAAKMEGSIVPADDALAPPLLMMEFTNTGGKKIRLRDFGTAGECSHYYLSWLKVQHVNPAPFSEANPLRSSRSTQ